MFTFVRVGYGTLLIDPKAHKLEIWGVDIRESEPIGQSLRHDEERNGLSTRTKEVKKGQ